MADLRTPPWVRGKSILAAGLHVLALAIVLPSVLLAALMLDDWSRVSTDWHDLLFGPKSGLGWLGLVILGFALLVYFCLALLARRIKSSPTTRVPTP